MTEEKTVALARVEAQSRPVGLQPTNYEGAIELAKQLAGSGMVPEALKGNPKDVEVHGFLGTALRTSDPAAAERHFAKVIELSPKAPGAYYYAGRMALKRGDTQAAKQRLEGFVALKPSGAMAAQAHYMLGNLASQAKDNEKAAEHYEKCIAADPQGSQAEKAKDLIAQVKGSAPSS